MEPVRILLVDDQSIILDGLEALIATDPGLVVCGRAADGAQAVERAKELAPDVVLMDISMPGMDGIEATRVLLKQVSDVRVLVLSMYNNVEFVHEVLDAGASGYLLKNTGRDELYEAIRAVSSGQRYLAAEVRRTMDEARRRTPDRDVREYQSLTKREKEIVQLIVSSLTTQEIANTLFLSPATIETHRKNIFHKLDLHNTAGLVKYALERGWELSARS